MLQNLKILKGHFLNGKVVNCKKLIVKYQKKVLILWKKCWFMILFKGLQLKKHWIISILILLIKVNMRIGIIEAKINGLFDIDIDF